MAHAQASLLSGVLMAELNMNVFALNLVLSRGMETNLADVTCM